MSTPTKLTKEEYLKKARDLKYNHGVSYAEMKTMPDMGIPMWDGIEYKIENTGKGGTRAKPRAQRRAQTKKDESLRQQNIRASTPENVDKRAAAAKAKRIRDQGLQVDHINEVSRTGPVIALLTAAEKARYLLRIATGDQAENYQGLSGSENRKKNRDLKKLDKHLGAMEAQKPSPTLQKLDARSPVLGQAARRLGMFSVPDFSGSNTALETYPTGGSVIQTDPGGLGLPMRIP